VIEMWCPGNFGSDLAETVLIQLGLETLLAVARLGQLLIVEAVNGGTVLGADVVALTHALSRVVNLPEQLEQFLVGNFLWVEYHQHGFRMAGQAGTDFFVGRVGRNSAGIAHGRRPDARLLPETSFRAPETALGEHCLLQMCREGRLQRIAIDEVGGRNLYRSVAAWQSLICFRQGLLVNENF